MTEPNHLEQEQFLIQTGWVLQGGRPEGKPFYGPGQKLMLDVGLVEDVVNGAERILDKIVVSLI